MLMSTLSSMRPSSVSNFLLSALLVTSLAPTSSLRLSSSYGSKRLHLGGSDTSLGRPPFPKMRKNKNTRQETHKKKHLVTTLTVQPRLSATRLEWRSPPWEHDCVTARPKHLIVDISTKLDRSHLIPSIGTQEATFRTLQ